MVLNLEEKIQKLSGFDCWKAQLGPEDRELWESITDCALSEALQNLLMIDPESRWSADEAMHSNWFAREFNRNELDIVRSTLRERVQYKVEGIITHVISTAKGNVETLKDDVERVFKDLPTFSKWGSSDQTYEFNTFGACVHVHTWSCLCIGLCMCPSVNPCVYGFVCGVVYGLCAHVHMGLCVGLCLRACVYLCVQRCFKCNHADACLPFLPCRAVPCRDLPLTCPALPLMYVCVCSTF